MLEQGEDLQKIGNKPEIELKEEPPTKSVNPPQQLATEGTNEQDQYSNDYEENDTGENDDLLENGDGTGGEDSKDAADNLKSISDTQHEIQNSLTHISYKDEQINQLMDQKKNSVVNDQLSDSK